MPRTQMGHHVRILKRYVTLREFTSSSSRSNPLTPSHCSSLSLLPALCCIQGPWWPAGASHLDDQPPPRLPASLGVRYWSAISQQVAHVVGTMVKRKRQEVCPVRRIGLCPDAEARRARRGPSASMAPRANRRMPGRSWIARWKRLTIFI